MYLVTRFGDPFLFHERNAGMNHQGTMPEVGEHLSITVNLSGGGTGHYSHIPEQCRTQLPRKPL